MRKWTETLTKYDPTSVNKQKRILVTSRVYKKQKTDKRINKGEDKRCKDNLSQRDS